MQIPFWIGGERMSSYRKLVMGFVLVASLSSYAGKMQSYCYMAENGKEVFGVNETKKMPIASVSKVLTSLAVLSAMGARTKLYTQFFAVPVSKDLFDVHIKGSRDPYFARASMHTLISRLNEMGVKHIRTLTFDENFKYLYNTNQGNSAGRGFYYDPITGKAPIDAPSADFVRRLLLNKKMVMQDYDKSRKNALTDKVVLVENPIYDVQKIEPIRSTDFKPAVKAQKGYVSSMELIDIIKYMNWNSNNHVANSLFLIAGGKEKVENLYYNKFKVSPEELTFVNGSGQNGDLTGNGRSYTEASCSVMVKTMKALKANLESQHMKLEDAIAVTGGDIGSTIDSAVYKKYFPAKTVIAKTGTVGVAISLAGLANTKKGNFFFMYNVEPRMTPGRMKARNAGRFRENEAAKSRGQIGQKLAEEMDSFESGNALGLEITNDKEYKKRKITRTKIGARGAPIAYQIRHYDVVNFEDSGDENAPEDAANDTKVFQGTPAVAPQSAGRTVSGVIKSIGQAVSKAAAQVFTTTPKQVVASASAPAKK
ncbi:MAG: D-alanyl-D-alanine carboxypeptidase [Bdellovibrio sp.]|nr:D-alanyl-D-alanine carboxypeptidase [Bdellovibrio sp.]